MTTESHINEPPSLASVVLAAHVRPRDEVARSRPARTVAVHANSNAGLRARAIDGANAGMRTAPVPRDRLFEVVEDVSMEPAARAAAVALGPELDDRGRARLRAAAEATVAPRLRSAIERATERERESDDAAIEAALAEIEAEGAKPRAME